MNIIYLHTTVWPSNSPSTTFVTYYTNALAAAGVNTELVVWKSGEMDDLPLTLEDYFGLTEIDNWKITAIDTEGNNSALKRRNYYKNVRNILRSRLQAAGDSVLITRSLSILPLLIRLRSEYPEVRILFETHNFYSNLKKIPGKSAQQIKSFLRERYYLPKCDALIRLQESQKKMYQDIYPDLKIKVLPSGCRDFQFDRKIEKLFTAVYIGSFDIHKGVGDLLNIWSGWDNSPRLMLIGGRNRQDIDRLNHQINHLKLSDKVELVEWKNPSELPEFVAKADVGLLPLHDTFFNRNLTFPLKLMDYISAGLPVIASDLPSLNSVLTDGHDAFLLREFTVDNVRKVFKKLMENPGLQRKMKDNISLLKHEYSWLKRAERTLEFISAL